MLPERANQPRALAHAGQGSAGIVTELSKVPRAEVGQLMLLPVPPEVFDGVELRRIRRQVLECQAAALGSNELPDKAAAMRAQAIPDHQHGAGHVAQQMLQERDDLRTANCAGEQAEVEVPPRDPRYGRQPLPVEVVLEHRRLAPRGPGATAMRALAQSAFVDEDDRLPEARGVFFTAGQRYRFQCAIAASSRSTARPVGRWQLHPSFRSSHQTWPG